jgi:Asp-tRNA(Asn)/Glu-tRNA(Gln) amidotransferase A subunit family amidase
MTTDLFRRPLRAIAAGEATAPAFAESHLARIAATDASIQAWAHLDPAHVRHEAQRCDAEPARGALAGCGIGVKDIIGTAELPTRMGSPVFEDARAGHDAACVAALKEAGGFVFGKTVTTEFAFLHAGKTMNPWNREHTPGGSSSGSAAAVAAGHVAGAIGTQTNGSVIRPAAFCGVVGFKPTTGAIPFAGVNVFSATLDALGTFTRNVDDAALLASVLAERSRIGASIVTLAHAPRLAYVAAFPWAPLDPGVDEAQDAAVTTLRRHGADVVAVELPRESRDAPKVLRAIMLHEGAQALGPLQQRERARLSPTLNGALDEGAAITRADYEGALAARGAAISALTALLAEFDAIVSPPARGAAPHGLGATGDPSCCTLWSLVGFPAITLPCALTRAGLPLGLQLAAPADRDDAVLAAAAWCGSKLRFRGLF